MKNIVQIFETYAMQCPDVEAIVSEQKILTYKELNAKATTLGKQLETHTTKEEETCFVYTKSPVTAIIAMLAIFKVKKIFIPINSKMNNEMISEMLVDYKPDWIICDEESLSNWQEIQGISKELEGLNVILSNGKLPYKATETIPAVASLLTKELNPNDPCYVYFTSGSTGKPKGILGAYRGINHYIDWELKFLNSQKPLKVAAFAPHSFDVFLRDTFAPLCSGGTIYTPPMKGDTLAVEKIPAWLEKYEINLMHCVPTLFRGIIQIAKNKHTFPHLKHILLAGEKLFWEDVSKWEENFGATTTLVNIYGPSETSLAKFAYQIPQGAQQEGIVSLGKPIEGAKAILLDENSNPCPTGTIGEIHIKTAYRTLGYYKNEALTNEKFITHPMLPNDILYKTGDYAFVDEVGDFIFSGRKDFQIKFNGIRIELGGIESALLQNNGIKNAAVVYNEKLKQLAGFIVADNTISTTEIKEELFAKLPMYMVPQTIIQKTELPLNGNGKINRLLLEKEFISILETNKKEYSAPNSQEEKVLVTIWSSLLERPEAEIGIEDNFFELGGHSMALVQMSNEIKTQLNREVAMLDLFKYPNIKSLCEYWNQAIEDHEIIEEDDDSLDIFDLGVDLFNDN